MPWRGQYDTFFLRAGSEGVPLWNWSSWVAATKSLDAIVNVARGPASVRTTQYLPGNKETIRFGRIGWDEKGHKKWTHGSPTNASESANWSFFDLEVWAPSWTVCEKESDAPDVYLRITNDSYYLEKPDLAKPPCFVLLTVRHEVADVIRDALNAAVMQLSNLLSPEISGSTCRSWRSTGGAKGYRPGIQDLRFEDLATRDDGGGYRLRHDDWHPHPESVTK
ncbi:MAG: hypothetical protein ACKV2Q_31630 [Planctomycetaceae bacterium]